ncbi:MAG: MBOAT family protein [Lachnospiraceae bacterium]|nr:MBOAT family protein [Lachnospiraceae bacterium]MBQ4069054.1 MBOAT family protein [Lachnospiraceae bacterium]
MVFSSIIFMYLYLPITLIVYFLTPARYRNIWLFLVNIVFYGWGEPIYILLMFFSITVNYIVGIMVGKYKDSNKKRAKTYLIVGIIINLALLLFFKYFDFIIESLSAIPFLSGLEPLGISLPIGISFYTFQAMSYPIDVYWGNTTSQKSYLNFATYVALFPQLIAGPIVRYKDVAAELEQRVVNSERVAKGIRRFCVGLAKKVLLANSIGQLWDVYNTMPISEMSVAGAWLGALAYTFQIYFDFSGYSDMAIGLGEMLGFKFLENFNYPYISKSITEFWRRWHISLSTWFRDYIYIPLGGNRKGIKRQIINILIVWSVTGLWHGASWNFVFWGLYYGLLLMVEKLFLYKWLQKIPAIFSHIYTLLLVIGGWMLFAIEDSSRLFKYLGTMFAVNGADLISSQAVYCFRNYAVLFIALIIASMPVGKFIYGKMNDKVKNIFAPIAIAAVLIICTAYLVDSTYNPFLYFRF